MKRMVAFAFYVLGSILALRTVVAGLGGDNIIDSLIGLAIGITMWWIAVGFGVRLGVDPDEFVASIKSMLGFGEEFDTQETSTEATNST